MAKLINLQGKKFGEWRVIEYTSRGYWLCECKCGNIKEVKGATLKNGSSTNCGCKRIKHGYEGTKIYKMWSHMKERCEYNKHKSYKDYGGRGIRVCEEWKEAKNFIDWSLKNGYREGLSIDRIDVNGDYEPSNCRFITLKEQQANKRNSKKITINGITKIVAEWARLCGLDRHTILYRIKKGEQGIEILRKGNKGGGWSGEDFKRYFNQGSKN